MGNYIPSETGYSWGSWYAGAAAIGCWRSLRFKCSLLWEGRWKSGDEPESTVGLDASRRRARLLRDDDASRPIMPRGGIRLLVSVNGMRQFDAPRNIDVCKSVTPKEAENPRIEDKWKIVKELHVTWGHAAAYRLRRILADAEWAHQCHSDCVGEEVGPREVCQASDEAPNVTIVGTPMVPSFDGKVRVSILSLGDGIASAPVCPLLGLYSKYGFNGPVLEGPVLPLGFYGPQWACTLGFNGPVLEGPALNGPQFLTEKCGFNGPVLEVPPVGASLPQVLAERLVRLFAVADLGFCMSAGDPDGCRGGMEE